jgi:hypothetical protein
VVGWGNKIVKMLPAKTSYPINIQKYAAEVEKIYKNVNTRIKEMGEQTFICATFLPDKDIDFFIKSKDM